MVSFRSFDPETGNPDPKTLALMAWLADVAYKNFLEAADLCKEAGFERTFGFDDAVTDTQAIMAVKPGLIVVCFRGTESFADVVSDAKIKKKPHPLAGEVHRGFKAGLDSVWAGPDQMEDVLKDLVKSDPKASVWLVGHSLGAALATLAAAACVVGGVKTHALVTFGSPRVGDSAFSNALVERQTNIFRVVNNNDVVTRVPPRSLGYWHVGDVVTITASGELVQGLSYWRQFLDRVVGAAQDFGKPGLDGMKDHSIRDGYFAALDKLVSKD